MKPDTKQTQFTRNRYNTTSAVYNLMEWPIEQFWYKKWRRQLWQQVLGPKILEIGVGTGKNITYYPKEVEVTGIDLSPGMLNRARKLLTDQVKDRISLREMDAQQMNFPDATFDEVLATFAFCSIPDPVLGLQEALRVTKPGGRLHLLEHMRADNKRLGSLMKLLDPPMHYLSGVHIARQTVGNVEKAGWEITKSQNLTATGIFKRIEATKPH